jgi:cytochrome c oxidase subunit 2
MTMASKSARKLLALTLALCALAFSGAALALEWNLRPAGSALAADIHWLHEAVMVICTVIFVGVFSFMFWACYAHRKSRGHKADQFHENTTVEVLWTVIPAVILVVIAWPTTRVLVAQKDTSNPDITIKVTGYQWKWGYDYVKGEGEGINVMAVLGTPREQIEGKAPKGEHYLLEVGEGEEMVVPVGKKIRMLTTAADVIHSWWVPAFGAKQDAIPGFIRDLWFRPEQTGVFRSQCVELCGKEHGFMPIVVKVVTQDEYTKWVDGRKKLMAAAADDPNKVWDLPGLVARGEKVYASICVTCHAAAGQGTPSLKAPALAGNKFVVGAEEGPIDTVLNGRPNTAMAAFGKQLSDTEIAAVITFVRNSWGNKGSDVQPAEVKARHK